MKKLNKLIITEELEQVSRFSFSEWSTYYNWYWKDDIDNIGFLRAVTEMEALDRLREAFPFAGTIRWISKEEFNIKCKK
ncbi:MAG: hypothetical protein ACRC8Z_16545 [Empedobacter falsenii]